MAISLESLERGVDGKPPRVIVYGSHGVGKTTFAAGAESPVVIATEDGAGLLDIPRFPLARNWAQVLEAVGALLKEEHSFKTVILDSLDWAERLAHDEVRRVHGEKIFGDYGKGYTFSTALFERLIEGLSLLRERKGMTIVLTGHAVVKRFDSPELEPFDRYDLDLHKGASSMVQEWADIILFATQKIYTKTTDVGFGKKQVRGVGTGDRVLFTEERPAHIAKNRYRLPFELPLEWGAFKGALDEARAAVARR
jgi:hypothetical protein